MDLDIDNYNLDEILKLFRLEYNFDLDDLKRAKHTALKTHPDKSGLDKKYFLFFIKAYEIVVKIYDFRHKSKKEVKKTEYEQTNMAESEKSELVKKLQKFKSAKDFNRWFNSVFEKVKIKSNAGGYGDWLESDDGIDDTKINNMNDFSSAFDKKKRECKDLIIHRDIKEMASNSGSFLSNARPEKYETDIFSKLNYNDLKEAHTVTVVPVTDEDYEKVKKFKDVDSYKRYRNETTQGPLSLQQSKKFLNTRKEREGEINTRRAFNLYKQDENIQKSNDKFWGFLKQLKN
jgi:hypothetical protein